MEDKFELSRRSLLAALEAEIPTRVVHRVRHQHGDRRSPDEKAFEVDWKSSRSGA